MRILLSLGRVVVRAALDYLHIAQRYAGRRVLGSNKAAQRDDGRDCKGDGGKEAKDILQPHQIRVHAGRVGEREALGNVYGIRARASGRQTLVNGRCGDVAVGLSGPNTYLVLSRGGRSSALWPGSTSAYVCSPTS